MRLTIGWFGSSSLAFCVPIEIRPLTIPRVECGVLEFVSSIRSLIPCPPGSRPAYYWKRVSIGARPIKPA